MFAWCKHGDREKAKSQNIYDACERDHDSNKQQNSNYIFPADRLEYVLKVSHKI